jgi:type II secretory ATPase GspE/PulE/Tfp pilus assembly ATPase PilB-like protein
MRAASTFDALDQWRKLVGDDRLATEALKLVINGRVLRTLCSACKVGYVPDPVTLRKLGISPEKVSTLFQARTQPLRDPKGNPIPCEFCHDVHFKGRSGVYEMFVIDDDAREVINAGRSPNQIFKKQRGRYLQEEALELVQAGQTSVQEVLRVLNATGGGGGGSAKRPPAGGGGGAPPAAARSPRPSSPSSTPRPAGSAPRIRKT